MTTLTGTIGYAAVVMATLFMMPQVIKSWKTKSMKDLATGTIVLYFINCCLWLTYGILISAIPVILANGIGLVVSMAQIGLNVKYGRKSELGGVR